MKIIFGLSLDRPLCPLPSGTRNGIVHAGPGRFLQLLEGFLGLQQPEREVEYLRIEQYRQALRHYLDQHPEPFFAVSFAADPFATAGELLKRRDELLLAGWDFSRSDGFPPRLSCLADIEKLLPERDLQLEPGFAERFSAVLNVLPRRHLPLEEIWLIEPIELLPVCWRRLLSALEQRADNPVLIKRYAQAPQGSVLPGSDLWKFRQLLEKGPASGAQFSGDGSLVLLRGKRDTDLAAYFAAWVRKNPDWTPVLLLPDLSGTLDNALVQEGIPSLGLQSASLARPALQALKLIPIFLWHPLDPFKVLEFASLSIKPLEEELATRIAHQMAQTPGVFSESWQAMLSRYFHELEAGEFAPSEPGAEEIRRQYRMWFERRRYDSAGSAPKEDALDMFRYLAKWAAEKFEKGEGSISMLILRAQAQRIVELLEALPEEKLSRLELERIVRTIYEAAPLQLRAQESGGFPYAQQPGAIPAPVDSLVWWNFVQTDPAFIFSRWSKEERSCLETSGIKLDGPDRESDLLLWQRKRPVMLAQRRLLLVMPDMVEGHDVQPHPLLGDLEAGFSNWERIVLDVASPEVPSWTTQEQLPAFGVLSSRQLGVPAPFIRVDGRALRPREEETFSSLEKLLYYPYQWVFRFALNLKKSAILSIVEDRTLFGNLAHRLFERLLKEPGLPAWSRAEVMEFISREAPGLFNREGAVLLLYGREPERVQFVKKVQYAAWSLTDLLQRNGWKVAATESDLEGSFADLKLKARADVILERGHEKAILDLKWTGASFREMSLRNKEDLQLTLYAHMLSDTPGDVHTAFFIMENGKMIARNHAAFQDILAVDPQVDHREVHQHILRRMEATYLWRAAQLAQGQIEVRSAQTRSALEAHYEESLLELLEMRKEDARYDDYRTLINLIQ